MWERVFSLSGKGEKTALPAGNLASNCLLKDLKDRLLRCAAGRLAGCNSPHSNLCSCQRRRYNLTHPSAGLVDILLPIVVPSGWLVGILLPIAMPCGLYTLTHSIVVVHSPLCDVQGTPVVM